MQSTHLIENNISSQTHLVYNFKKLCVSMFQAILNAPRHVDCVSRNLYKKVVGKNEDALLVRASRIRGQTARNGRYICSVFTTGMVSWYFT